MEDYRDLFEEEIVRLEKLVATLDPLTDDYKKASEQLMNRYRLKIEEANNEEEAKLKARHEENAEIDSEREYEEAKKKRRHDIYIAAAEIGTKLLIFAAGMTFNAVCFDSSIRLEEHGTASYTWLRNLLKNLGPYRNQLN